LKRTGWKELISTIFHAAYMERWNDKIRPMPMVELDKQAHKMVLAYFFAKFETSGKDLDWCGLIEGGLFEMLQRVVVTDIKPHIYYRIKADRERYRRLNTYVIDTLRSSLTVMGQGFMDRFQDYFEEENNTPVKRILNAAHIFSSNWEFEIVAQANPNGYDIREIHSDFRRKLEAFYDLDGMRAVMLYNDYRRFVDLCGTLRFQYRWANVRREPKTSVLGHSLFVAIMSYLFSLHAGACPRRCYNNYFGGLFHDLPEVLTRDIVSPLKSAVEGLRGMIAECEREMMEETVYPLLPHGMEEDIRTFTEDEFQTTAIVDGVRRTVPTESVNQEYNRDEDDAKDGALILAADELSAYIEAITAIENGSTSPEFAHAQTKLAEKYLSLKEVAGVPVGQIYREYERDNTG